tara:strand:- start:4630 stop:6219 length:1590 start_codon:yes stop_codon:yes gene_type:complete
MIFKLPAKTNPKFLEPGLYKVDFLNRTPLFAVKEKKSLQLNEKNVLCDSWEDAFSLKDKVSLQDISKKYIGAYISNCPNTICSPYKFIRRLPRNHFISFDKNRRISCFPYEPFSGGMQPFKKSDDFYEFVKMQIIENIKSNLKDLNGGIGVELSSGLDSNSILCAISEGVDINRVHAWSFPGSGEISYIEKFREIYGLNLSQCYAPENKPKTANISISEREKIIEMLGFPMQIGSFISEYERLSLAGCTSVFSGLGGDQCLSNNGGGAESTFLNELRFVDLYSWHEGITPTLRSIATRLIGKINRNWIEKRINYIPKGFLDNRILERNLTSKGKRELKPYFIKQHPWEKDYFKDHRTSIKKRILNDWISIRMEDETRLARKFNLEVFYPLLDQFLIASCLNQDVSFFSNSINDGRLILRKGFEKLLPDFHIKTSTKSRKINETEYIGSIKRNFFQLESLLKESYNWHPFLKEWWDVDKIRIECEELLEQNLSNKSNEDISQSFLLNNILDYEKEFLKLFNLSIWFSKLE